MINQMRYRVFVCLDCNRPVVPNFGNFVRVTSNFQLEATDIERWRHRNHEIAPEAVPLGEGDHQVGDGMRDSTGEECIVTKVFEGKLFGVRVSDLAQQSGR